MNGKDKILLDTNAVISLLSGNNALNSILLEAVWVGISVVTKLEFLSFPDISIEDVELFRAFEKRVFVVNILSTDEYLMTVVVNLRKKDRLKIPDAIILASAIKNNAVVFTDDKQLLASSPDVCLPLPLK